MRSKRTSLTVAVIIAVFATLDCGGLAAADEIHTAGDILLGVLPSAAAGLALGHRDGQGALQLGASLAVTLDVTVGLKLGIHAERPNGGEESFPSGHTSISFSAAEFVRKRYGWGYGGPAYAAAAFVAYSRVEAREHHPQDVVAGAVIGILTSYIFTEPYKGWHVGVEGGRTSFGVRLSRHF